MRKWLFALLCVSLLSALIVWRIQQKESAASAQTLQRKSRISAPSVVSVTTPQERDIVQRFDGVGTLEAPLDVRVSAKITGRIVMLNVLPGARVHRGDLLVQIDDSDLMAQVAQKRAALRGSEDRLAQAQTTQVATNTTATGQVQQQQAGVLVARANENQVRSNYAQQVATAQAAVADAVAKASSAEATIGTAKAQVRSAQANLANSQTQLDRANALAKQGAVAQQIADAANTEVQVQQGALDVAQAQLSAAQSARDSARAMVSSAQHQLSITETKGKADIATADAQVTQAGAAERTAVANLSQKPAYQQNLEALAADVAAARADLADTQAMLSETIIRCPIDGYVAARMMDPGAVATPGQTILSVQYVGQVWVNVPVPEGTAHQVVPGMPATITLDSLPGRTFMGKVSSVPPGADPMSRQFPVRITVDNSSGLLRPGTFARVSIVLSRVHSRTVLPPEAIDSGPKGSTVDVVDSDGTAHRVPVSLGAQDDNGVAVLQGVDPGQKIIVLSATPIKDGQKVRLGGAHGGKSGARGHAGGAAAA